MTKSEEIKTAALEEIARISKGWYELFPGSPGEARPWIAPGEIARAALEAAAKTQEDGPTYVHCESCTCEKLK